ncbi:MAG TPA: hypothetical protein VN946_11510 [Terriglobales bacterium]|jgi:hypothetical protein|nr:hypothetical protein [Terriglobales bacterium]
MAAKALDRQLTELEASRYKFALGEAPHIVKLLNRLEGAHFPAPPSLIRFHEALLFLRAFPQAPAVVRSSERILNNFYKKVEALHKAGADMDDFDTFEVSGIAGTEMEDTLSFDVAKWLIKRLRGKVEIAWDNYEPGRELGTTGPRFIPLLEDDANVEADTPWQLWLETTAGAAGRNADKRKKKAATATWLIDRFDQLPLPPQQKAELYESLRVPLRWKLENSVITRTRNRKPLRAIFDRSTFYHTTPLISRSQVSLTDELAKRPPKLTKLSLKQGDEIMELIREVMLVRYRELYGTTLGDPRSVVRADVGRGVTIYLWNLPPERRLPLRAYIAGLTLKNGVPINYIEAIGLCEWMEVGFNTFYTFRGGEAGWIYAQVLRCLCHRMGTTCVSVYPYQLGKDNEEAIESGAFWFYRKLGFRPGRPDLQKLAEQEEAKIAADSGSKTNTTKKYRTPARTLRRLADGHAFYELPGSDVGAWDKFSTRNIGLHINKRMARDFGGGATEMRKHSSQALEKILNVKIDDLGSGTVSPSSWAPQEKSAFENFALILADAPELGAWTHEEKQALLQIIRAKGRPDEMLYQHLTQCHARLRKALLKLGS